MQMSGSENNKLEKYVYFSKNSTKKEVIHSTEAYSIGEAIERFALLKKLAFYDFLSIYAVEKSQVSPS